MKSVGTKLSNFIFLFLVFSGLFFGFSVQAIKIGFGVNPQIFEMDVFPGEKHQKKIRVTNLSEVPIPLTVRVVDFTAAQDSGETIFDEVLEDPSIASRKWFEIENPDLILDVNEKREIKFSINIPENAETGGHYSMMIFEPRLSPHYFETLSETRGEESPVSPRGIPVIGVPFLLSVKTFALEPEIEKKLEVVEFSVPKEERIEILEAVFSLLQHSYQRLSASIGIAYAAGVSEIEVAKKTPSSFVLRIKNNDIYHLRPFGKVSIYNIFGKKVGETEVPKLTILPGKTRAFPVNFSPEIPEKLKWLPASISNFLAQNLFFGKYQAQLELTESAQLILGHRLIFFSLSWQFWLPFLLFLVLLIVFIVKYRERIVLAAKTLVSPKSKMQS